MRGNVRKNARVASAGRHRIRRSNRCHAPAGNIYCARDPLERVRRTAVYYYHQIEGGRALRAGTSEHFRESPRRRVSVDLLFTCAKETDKNRHFRAVVQYIIPRYIIPPSSVFRENSTAARPIRVVNLRRRATPSITTCSLSPQTETLRMGGFFFYGNFKIKTAKLVRALCVRFEIMVDGLRLLRNAFRYGGSVQLEEA